MFNPLGSRCFETICCIKKYLSGLFSYVRIFSQFVFIAGLLVLNIFMSQAQAFQSQSRSEQLKVKAAFILNLARFVEWPVDPKKNNMNDVVMCFYQHNFLEQAIDTIRNKKINNKVIYFKVVQSLQIKERCDVVLIPALSLAVFLQHNQYDNLQQRITITDLSSVWSQVSSLENKIIFRLKRDQSRLRFEVNKKAAEQLGVKIGSELLKLGIMVTDPESNKQHNDQGRNKQ